MEFSFKGRTSKEFDLIFDIKKYPILKKPKYDTVEIPGKEGSIKFFDGYEDAICEIDILIKGRTADRLVKIHQLQGWLMGTGKLKLPNTEGLSTLSEIDMTVSEISQVEYSRNHEVIKVEFVNATAKDIKFEEEKPAVETGVLMNDYFGFMGYVAEYKMGVKEDV